MCEALVRPPSVPLHVAPLVELRISVIGGGQSRGPCPRGPLLPSILDLGDHRMASRPHGFPPPMISLNNPSVSFPSAKMSARISSGTRSVYLAARHITASLINVERVQCTMHGGPNNPRESIYLFKIKTVLSPSLGSSLKICQVTVT